MTRRTSSSLRCVSSDSEILMNEPGIRVPTSTGETSKTGEKREVFQSENLKIYQKVSDFGSIRGNQGKLCQKITNIFYMMTKRIVVSVLYFS